MSAFLATPLLRRNFANASRALSGITSGSTHTGASPHDYSTLLKEFGQRRGILTVRLKGSTIAHGIPDVAPQKRGWRGGNKQRVVRTTCMQTQHAQA
jgi:hypothetical protein